MILLALKEYVDDERLKRIEVPPPEALPSVAIYHPDAPALFESFDDYRSWYLGERSKSKAQSPKPNRFSLNPTSTVGRSEEHTSELQSRGLISYAVFCLKKK